MDFLLSTVAICGACAAVVTTIFLIQLRSVLLAVGASVLAGFFVSLLFAHLGVI